MIDDAISSIWGLMPRLSVEFMGSRGDMLAGLLDLPDDRPRGLVLYAHCFTCSKDSRATSHIARALVDEGFGVLRFDFTGLGDSGGDFADTGFSSNVDDLVAAADWLRKNHGPPELLVGHSLGGAAVLAAAGRIDDSLAVATISAPFDPAHVISQFEQHVDDIMADGKATVKLAGRPFVIKRSFVEDLQEQKKHQPERIRNLRRPLMVLHAPGDTLVSVDEAAKIFTTAMHPKSFVSLDTANHLLTSEADARFAAHMIAAWAVRYLNPVED